MCSVHSIGEHLRSLLSAANMELCSCLFGSEGSSRVGSMTYKNSFARYGIIGDAGSFQKHLNRFSTDAGLPISDAHYRKEKSNCSGPVYAVRSLRGHMHHVNATCWSMTDPSLLVSVGKDGKLFTWDVALPRQVSQVSLANDMPMSCSISPSNSLVAWGGLGATGHILKRNVESGEVTETDVATLSDHEGYIAGCAFLSDAQLLTGSGDSTCKVFDVNTATTLRTFTHSSDTLAVVARRTTQAEISAQEFFSASDNTLCHWDMRQGSSTAPSQRIVLDRKEDITSLSVCPGNEYLVACGTNSGDCWVYDIRADTNKCVIGCVGEDITQEVSSVALSYTGDYLFVGYRSWVKRYMDCVLTVFDTSGRHTVEDTTSNNVPMAPHCVIGDNSGITSTVPFSYSFQNCTGKFISSVQLNCDGCALAVGSHDCAVTVFRQQR